MDKKLIIVTGSSGRIGSNVVKALSSKYKVVGFELLRAVYASPDEELVPVDLASDESVHMAFRHIRATYGTKIAAVIHLAAYYSFSEQHSDKYELITVNGTKRLLTELQQFEVEQFLFSSTMLVHAPCEPGHPITEDSPVVAKWDYPLSKVHTEKAMHDLRGNIPTVVLRIAGVYDDKCHSIPISHQIQRIYEKQLESRLFSGNTSHGSSFVHMDDVIDAIVRSVEKRKELPPETVLLIGEAETLSYDQLQRQISCLLYNTEFTTIRVPKLIAKLGSWLECHIPFRAKPFIRPWMIALADDHYELNIDRAHRLLGWAPKHSLEKTLPIMIEDLKRDPIAWYKFNQLDIPNWLEKKGEPPMIPFLAALLGIWLLAAPLTFGYPATNDWICGALLIFLGLFVRARPLATWGFAFIGLWLGFAPLLFWAPVAAYLNDTIAGTLAIALFLLLPAWPRQLPETGPSIPPGWSYNPSSWPQRIPIAFLAFIGWMLSRYMAAYQLGYIDQIADPFFPNGTLHVITSDVSKAFPIPDAGLGALAYSLEMLSTFKGGDRRWRTMPWMVLVFGLLAIPLSLTSVILILLQPLVVGAWCTWCLITAFCMLILMALSIDEVVAALQYLKNSKEKPLLKLLLQGGQCPGAKNDERTPELDESLWTLLKASAWGLTFPLNLLLATLLGAALMCLPAHFALTGLIADLNHALGALIIVISMISFSEIARPTRWLNLFFTTAITIAAIQFTAGIPLWIELALCLAITALSIPCGSIRERTLWQ